MALPEQFRLLDCRQLVRLRPSEDLLFNHIQSQCEMCTPNKSAALRIEYVGVSISMSGGPTSKGIKTPLLRRFYVSNDNMKFKDEDKLARVMTSC